MNKRATANLNAKRSTLLLYMKAALYDMPDCDSKSEIHKAYRIAKDELLSIEQQMNIITNHMEKAVKTQWEMNEKLASLEKSLTTLQGLDISDICD